MFRVEMINYMEVPIFKIVTEKNIQRSFFVFNQHDISEADKYTYVQPVVKMYRSG